jgi:tRNA dimethylallyltransferase
VGGRTPYPRSSPLVKLPLVIAVFGPTASGKTAVAEALTERLEAEIVSADSMQVYCGLPILTNQPARPTTLVGLWPLDHEASVAAYAQAAHAEIDGILAEGRTPIVAGGTGLYLRAALADLGVPSPPPRVGGTSAHSLLAARDPEAALRVHPNDRRRVVRALELVEAGFSLRPAQDRLWAEETRHPTSVFGLVVPRATLDRRIEQRTGEMFERGVEEEVRRALASGVSATVRQVIGLREISELPREQAIPAIVARTRRYAAYQRKWMRRIPGLVALDADRAPAEVAAEILALVQDRAWA